MSPLLLRAFVNERLTAVLGEILEVFEGAIAKYEEEATNSKQEIDRLRCLLLELQSQRTEVPRPSTCRNKPPCEPDLQGTPWNLDLQQVKEEDPELWAADGEEQTLAGTDSDVLNLPGASDREEQEDIKPPGRRWTESSVLDELQEVQEAKHAELRPTQQDEAAAIFTPGRTEAGQTSSGLSMEPTDLSHLNPHVVDYRCSLCSQSFPSGPLLVDHAFRAHSGEADASSGGGPDPAESLDGARRRPRENPKVCHLCGKLLRSTTSMKEHMAGHAGLKLHRCHVCGKACRRKGDLRIHTRIHTGEKPFHCSLCCKSFTHSGHLKKHTRSHTGERPYRCDVCGRGFLQSAHLKSHLATHAKGL